MHLIRKISPKITTDKTLMQTKRKRIQNPRTQKNPKISITCNTVVTMTLQKKKAKQRERH